MAIDLNLLPVFQALLEERRVGRAALRLNLSQSAVSHALGRLRDAVGDPLFVRSPQGLVPTARARALAPAVNEALARLDQALAPERYDAASSARRFRVAMGGYIGRLFSPALVVRMLARSPNCSCEVWNKQADLFDLMDAGVMDLAIGNFTDLPARFNSQLLLREEAVWIARPGHPAAFGARTVDELLAMPRVEITSGSAELNRSEAWFAHDRKLRGAWQSAPRPVVEVNMSQSAIDIVRQTDLIALVPTRILAEATGDLRMQAIDLGGHRQFVEVAMAWTRTKDDEPALRWLRALVEETAREIAAADEAD